MRKGTRKFGHRYYILGDAFEDREKALQRAERFRATGYLARVVKRKSFLLWGVYIFPKT